MKRFWKINYLFLPIVILVYLTFGYYLGPNGIVKPELLSIAFIILVTIFLIIPLNLLYIVRVATKKIEPITFRNTVLVLINLLMEFILVGIGWLAFAGLIS